MTGVTVDNFQELVKCIQPQRDDSERVRLSRPNRRRRIGGLSKYYLEILSETYRGNRDKQGDIGRTVSHLIKIQSGFGC